MKKIIFLFTVVFILISLFFDQSFAGCTKSAEDGFNVGAALDECLSDSKLVDGSKAGLYSGGGVSDKVQRWVNNISLYLGLFAVLSIVFGAMMMTFSGGEDEKVKKGKDVVKWGIIGFVGLLSVSAIINLIVKIMYSI